VNRIDIILIWILSERYNKYNTKINNANGNIIFPNIITSISE